MNCSGMSKGGASGPTSELALIIAFSSSDSNVCNMQCCNEFVKDRMNGVVRVCG